MRFFSTNEKRAANIAEMVSRLQGRNVKVIVFNPAIPRRYYRWNGIHLPVEGHIICSLQLCCHR
jgi:hypothetical protein